MVDFEICLEAQAAGRGRSNAQANGSGLQQIGPAIRGFVDRILAVGELILLDPGIERRINRAAISAMTAFAGWLGYQLLYAIRVGRL